MPAAPQTHSRPTQSDQCSKGPSRSLIESSIPAMAFSNHKLLAIERRHPHPGTGEMPVIKPNDVPTAAYRSITAASTWAKRGPPVYAVAVVLAGFLAFAGLGSAVADPQAEVRSPSPELTPMMLLTLVVPLRKVCTTAQKQVIDRKFWPKADLSRRDLAITRVLHDLLL